jgi:hypothetical protein
MKRKASSQLEPNMSPAASNDDVIDPQLRERPTKRPALSSSQFDSNMSPTASQEGLIDPQLLERPATRSALSSSKDEHITSASDDHSISKPASSSEHEESEIDDEDATIDQDFEEDDQNAPQVYAAAQTMAGVGQLATLHGDQGDMHAGFYTYMQARRNLTIDNDDHQELITYHTPYVRQVYNAITTVPASMTANQTKMVTLWGKKLNALGNDADQYMADLASMVIAGVWSLHVNGDFLFDAQFKSLKPHDDDSTMTATERVDVMCDILHNHKKIVIDIMGGFDAVSKFVAAPKGSSKRKQAYKSNNDHKAAQKTELEAVAKSVGREVGRKKGGKKDGKKGGKKGVKNDDDDEYEDEDDA